MTHESAKKPLLLVAIPTIIIVIVLALTGIYKLNLLLHESDQYRDCNPEKMLSYLEKTYGIDFPEDIKDVKAAKGAYGWGGESSFIIKFAAKPDVFKKFLKSVPGNRYKLEPYSPLQDKRLRLLAPYVPQWYKEPITKGNMCHIKVEMAHIKNVDFLITIYIDTSAETTFIVYMWGTYKSDIQ